MEEEGIVVVSCFDGMACARIALERLGIKVKRYYAFEIDKYAMAVAKANYPDIIHLGDIRNASIKELSEERIDLICGGSPCQGFSFAGKQLAFDDPRSKLFFEFVRLVNECKELNPDVLFLLENVKMKREHELVISKYMGVSPIEINAALVSAQNRRRLFWTNINNKPYGLFGDMYCDIPQPKDRGILLKDILQPENEVDEKYYLKDSAIEKMNIWEQRQKENGNGFKIEYRNENEKSSTLQTSVEKSASTVLKLDKQLNEKQNQEKASCITGGGHSGGNHSDMDLICVAMRGRGENNEQQLEEKHHQQDELNYIDGKARCLVVGCHGNSKHFTKTVIPSVQKDNLVIQVNPSLESGGKQPYQQNRVYDSNGIAPALCRDKSDLLIVHNMQPRTGKGQGGKGHLTKQDGKSYCCDTTNSNAIEFLNDNQLEKFNPEINADKSCCLTEAQGRAGSSSEYMDSISKLTKLTSRIRRLTPRECARLQSIPEHIITTMLNCGVSDSQLYKMLGNGWNIEVIVHILSYAPFCKKT